MSLIYLTLHGVGPVVRSMDSGEHSCWLESGALEALLDLVQAHSHVRLTVDDGNESDHAIVLPALLRRRLRAVFFICSDRLDQPTFLSRAQVRELRACGMGIGVHGAGHTPWRPLGADELRREIVDSRRTIEDVCDTSIDEAACPFGSYGRRVLRALRAEGYRAVYTSDGGRATEAQWLRPRTTVRRSTSLADVDRMIQSGAASLGQALTNVRTAVKRFRA